MSTLSMILTLLFLIAVVVSLVLLVQALRRRVRGWHVGAAFGVTVLLGVLVGLTAPPAPAQQAVQPQRTTPEPTPTPTPAPAATEAQPEQDPAQLRASDYGAAWPLTIDGGKLVCNSLSGNRQVLYLEATNGTTYTVNGTAKAYFQGSYPHITDVWKDDPNDASMRMPDPGIIERGLKLCS